MNRRKVLASLSWGCALLRNACSGVWQNTAGKRRVGGIFIPDPDKVTGGVNEGLQRTKLVFHFSDRKALRNAAFPKCHKGL